WSDGVTEALRTDNNVQADITVSAIFAKKKYNVTYATDDNGALSGEAKQVVEYGNDATEVTAIPNEGYEFVKWSDGVTEATRTDNNVQADITVSAIFGKKKYSVMYVTDGNGHIQGESFQNVEQGETAAEVTAIPNEGYEFKEWSDGVNTATRQDDRIFSELTVKAEFRKKTYYKLQYLVNGEGGSIQGYTIQYVAHGESGSTVIAVPDEGYEFAYWSGFGIFNIAARTDNNITQDTTIVAIFRRKEVQVEYKGANGGSIYYIKNVHTIYYGEQSSVVRANPYKGYVFLYWSDGLKSAERTEYNVTSDMVLTAYFGYSAEYKVNGHGRIKGEIYQAVLPDDDFSQVEAVPDEGYAFGGWSDLQVQNLRKDTNAERCIEHIAYFEPIVKTFSFDYGIASGVPMESAVTISRENIVLEGYPTPTLSGYTFEGWYADSDYKLKVINGDGRYMLGYYGFSLDTDTLYARWKPSDDSRRVFKILLVFVNEVKAKIYPSPKYGDGVLRDVHHLMTTIDREYCIILHDYAIYYLRDWLSELTDVEIDAYFTIDPISEENIRTFPDFYSLIPESISETKPLYTSYNSVLFGWSLNNYDGALAVRNITGSATEKFGNIHLDHLYYCIMIHYSRLQDYLIKIKTNRMEEDPFINTFIHEFIHTCEATYDYSEIVEFHDSFYNAYLREGVAAMEAYRLYLVGQLEYCGQFCGIPKDFWTNKCDKMLSITHY
ncbi:MAG: InlB B-repeat-containing protein, partial [Clostridiales bacterium]|nr:InlB B-repeat-containing protein [Clostridiales bacterium]